MSVFPAEIFEAIAYHAGSICTFDELLQLRRVSRLFQACFEKLIFDHLHLDTRSEGKGVPYLPVTDPPYSLMSRVKLYEYAIHPHMLARMITRYDKHWERSESVLSSQVQKTAQALRDTYTQQGLSINNSDERDLLACMITNNGPHTVLQMLHADADVCPEPTNKHLEHAMLALSTHRNDVESVRSFLESDAELDKHSGIFGPVIYSAATHGHFEIFQLLHRYGAEINGPAGGWRGNCLQTAALGGHIDIVHLLLSDDLGLDIQRGDYKPRLQKFFDRIPCSGTIDSDFGAAVLCAIYSGNDMVVVDLLKHMESRQLPLPIGTSQLILAAAMNTSRTTCLDAVLRGMRFDANILDMALRNAVAEVNQTQVHQILAASALQAPHPDWTSCALDYVANHGLVEYLDIILAHGHTMSPSSAARILCSALLSRQHDIVHILIARRIGIPYGENHPLPPIGFGNGPRLRPTRRLSKVREQAPLSAAVCSRKNIGFLQKFIDNGTNLEYDNAGIWALNTAAWSGNVSAVQILLAAGVDATAGMPSDPSWTPMKLAAINGRESVVRFLEQTGQVNPVIDAAEGRKLFTGRENPPRGRRKHRSSNAT